MSIANTMLFVDYIQIYQCYLQVLWLQYFTMILYTYNYLILNWNTW